VQSPTSAPERSKPSMWRRWGPIAVFLTFTFGKAKWLFAALKLFKLHSLLSMILAVGVYATIFGFKFALGFVLLIFVHEMGHALAMRQQGIPAGAPVFIPFVGAVIAMRGRPRNAYIEAIVGIGGPILGSVGAAVCLGVALATGEPFWYALASSGFLINLFNLIPIHPLDGGRIISAVSRWLWVVGYAVGIGVFLVTYSPILFLILLLGIINLKSLLRSNTEDYYAIPAGRRLMIGSAYFGLLATLALASWMIEEPLKAIPLAQNLQAATAAFLATVGAARRDRVPFV